MAIGPDAAIDVFGTQDTLGTSSASVADGAFSIASDLSTWTHDDDTREASFVASFTFSVTPNTNSSINLFARALNVQSTNDAEVPDANFQDVYLGSFPVNDVTTTQYSNPLQVSLPNNITSQQYEFYINPEAGQTVSAGWDIYPTPKTLGPHA